MNRLKPALINQERLVLISDGTFRSMELRIKSTFIFEAILVELIYYDR